MAMTRFSTAHIDSAPQVKAPDGSTVSILLSLSGGSMAQFELQPGQVSQAVVHRTVEEIWFVVAGAGDMWRSQSGVEEVTPLQPGTCLTLPVGTRFQFRASAAEGLKAVAITLPPWPGDGEAVWVDGPWTASVAVSAPGG